jgi:hypothetical protein
MSLDEEFQVRKFKQSMAVLLCPILLSACAGQTPAENAKDMAPLAGAIFRLHSLFISFLF